MISAPGRIVDNLRDWNLRPLLTRRGPAKGKKQVGIDKVQTLKGDDVLELRRIGDFSLEWGESLRWDDQKQRLYFIDFSSSQLHWLENAVPPLNSLLLESRPTGIGLVEDGRLLVAMENGLHLIDADSKTTELLTPYPKEIGKRANDATVDPAGNFVTGSLNIGARSDTAAEPGRAPGSFWWFSGKHGWRQLDDDITNANGPVCLTSVDGNRLVFADTPAQKSYVFDYDAIEGTVRNRRIYADFESSGGFPDGACTTADGGVLSCVLGTGTIHHYSDAGLQKTIEAGSGQPSDVCFGGKDLDRLFVVNIKVDLGIGRGVPQSPLAGSLLSIEKTGLKGVVENRFRL